MQHKFDNGVPLYTMTVNDFNSLEEDEQWLTLKEAVQLAIREDEDHSIYLFQLDGFYVEVFCHKRNYTAGYCKAFSTLTELEPYLAKINIQL